VVVELAQFVCKLCWNWAEAQVASRRLLHQRLEGGLQPARGFSLAFPLSAVPRGLKSPLSKSVFKATQVLGEFLGWPAVHIWLRHYTRYTF
jgi:hypothetical protein